MKKYRITYSDGVEQTKNLLTEEEFRIVTELKEKLWSKEQELEGINRKKKPDLWKKCHGEIEKLKSEISKFGAFFIQDSPLGKAMTNGGHLILPTYKSDKSTNDYYPTVFEELEQ